MVLWSLEARASEIKVGYTGNTIGYVESQISPRLSESEPAFVTGCPGDFSTLFGLGNVSLEQ